MVAKGKAIIVVITFVISVRGKLKGTITKLPTIILGKIVRCLPLFVGEFHFISYFIVSIFGREGYFVFIRNMKGRLSCEK